MAERSLISYVKSDEVDRHLERAMILGLSTSQQIVVNAALFYKIYGAVRYYSQVQYIIHHTDEWICRWDQEDHWIV